MIIHLIIRFSCTILFVYLGITKLNNWNYFNSFLVLIVLCILAKIITDFIAGRYHQLKQYDHDTSKFTFSFYHWCHGFCVCLLLSHPIN
jgi:hypothetical protein